MGNSGVGEPRSMLRLVPGTLREMKRVFDRAVAGREAARILADLRQGERSVSDYSIEFRTLAAECRWNEEAQWDMFLHGLADRVQKEIYVLDLPTTLNGLIDLALRVMHDWLESNDASLPAEYLEELRVSGSAAGTRSVLPTITSPCR